MKIFLSFVLLLIVSSCSTIKVEQNPIDSNQKSESNKLSEYLNLINENHRTYIRTPEDLEPKSLSQKINKYISLKGIIPFPGGVSTDFMGAFHNGETLQVLSYWDGTAVFDTANNGDLKYVIRNGIKSVFKYQNYIYGVVPNGIYVYTEDGSLIKKVTNESIRLFGQSQFHFNERFLICRTFFDFFIFDFKETENPVYLGKITVPQELDYKDLRLVKNKLYFLGSQTAFCYDLINDLDSTEISPEDVPDYWYKGRFLYYSGYKENSGICIVSEEGVLEGSYPNNLEKIHLNNGNLLGVDSTNKTLIKLNAQNLELLEQIPLDDEDLSFINSMSKVIVCNNIVLGSVTWVIPYTFKYNLDTNTNSMNMLPGRWYGGKISNGILHGVTTKAYIGFDTINTEITYTFQYPDLYFNPTYTVIRGNLIGAAELRRWFVFDTSQNPFVKETISRSQIDFESIYTDSNDSRLYTSNAIVDISDIENPVVLSQKETGYDIALLGDQYLVSIEANEKIIVYDITNDTFDSIYTSYNFDDHKLSDIDVYTLSDNTVYVKDFGLLVLNDESRITRVNLNRVNGGTPALSVEAGLIAFYDLNYDKPSMVTVYRWSENKIGKKLTDFPVPFNHLASIKAPFMFFNGNDFIFLPISGFPGVLIYDFSKLSEY